MSEHALLGQAERLEALLDRFAIPVKRDPLWSVFSLTEHALLGQAERIEALLDRFAIPVKRDPL